MFSETKFASLNQTTRLRKLGRLIDQFLTNDTEPNRLELRSFLGLFAPYGHDYPDLYGHMEAAKTLDQRELQRLVMVLDDILGVERADWDFRQGSTDHKLGRNGSWVYCEDIRSPFNLGSIFRTAEAFGFEGVGLSTLCTNPTKSDRLRRSSMGTAAVLRWIQADFDAFRLQVGDLPVFALELGGTDIKAFDFPKAGIVVLGSEELGVSGALLSHARESKGIASIDLQGHKASLNVGVSFGILAQEWTTRGPLFLA